MANIMQDVLQQYHGIQLILVCLHQEVMIQRYVYGQTEVMIRLVGIQEKGIPSYQESVP